MLIGKNLLHWMKYTPTTGYMYYKSDYQTMLGTRATGVKRNWLYRLHTSAAKRVTIAELPVFSPSNEPIDPENNEQEKAIEKAWKGGALVRFRQKDGSWSERGYSLHTKCKNERTPAVYYLEDGPLYGLHAKDLQATDTYWYDEVRST